MDPFAPVQPGQAMRPKAVAWNGAMAAARAEQARRLSGGLSPYAQALPIVTVRNNSGEDLPRFAALGIDGVMFPPSTYPEDGADQEFFARVCLAGAAPVRADHAGLFVLLLEPIADGESGRATMSGVLPAKITVDDADDQYADVQDFDAGDTDTWLLKSGRTGAARILYKAAGTGPGIEALLDLGRGTGPAHFAVKVTQVGGSGGGPSTQCSFTYDVESESGIPLGSAMTPARRRPAAGPFSAPPANSWGSGFFAVDGTFVLWDANEVPAVEVCP